MVANVQAAVTREATGTSCNPTITVTVSPAATTSSWVYEEETTGLTPSVISGQATYNRDSGSIRLGPFLNTTSESFSYTLSAADGDYTLTGWESQDGNDLETGKTDITIDCRPPQVTAPVFDPAENTGNQVNVSISSSTDNAEIYYTADGSTPDQNSTLYEGPFIINTPINLRAIAVAANMRDSQISTITYSSKLTSQALTLERTIGGTVCRSMVSITATPIFTTYAYTIDETLPAGLTPENITGNAFWDSDNRVIRWEPFLDNSSRILTYELIGDDKFYDLKGVGSFDGMNLDIGGMTQAEIDCIPDQAEAPVLDPVDTKAPVQVSMSSATDNAIIRYTLDGSSPDENSTIYSGPVMVDKEMTIKARSFHATLAASDVTEAKYYDGRRPKAVIVAGGGPYEGNSLWPATQTVSVYAYQALLYQGYDKDDIWFLSSDTTADIDGNGDLDDVDGAASSVNIEHAITNWAADASEVLIYLTDHGGNSTFMVAENDTLAAADLNNWLDTLQDSITGRVIVVYDACQSGTFLGQLRPPTGKERIVITSASNEPALFLENGVLSFSFQFWSSIFYTGNLSDAYNAGHNIMRQDQRSLLDSNGNGIANEKTDKLLIHDINIGRGMVAASAPPVIQAKVGEQILTNGDSATVWAENITSLDGLSRVWAVITPPNSRSASADTPVTDLPILEMTDPDADGRYTGTYSNFTLNGTYELLIFAKDRQGMFSLPVRTTVVQSAGTITVNTIPQVSNVNLTTAEDTILTGILNGSDQDGDSLTYIIDSDGEIGTVTLTDLNTGAFKYAPHVNENGTDSFIYKVNDGKADSVIATVSITITPVEDQPIAIDKTITTELNTVANDSLTAEDGDNDQLTFAIVSQPGHGQVLLTDSANGTFAYTPVVDYYGPDSFTFKVNDSKAESSPGTVTVNVKRGYNTKPTVLPQSFNGEEDIILNGSLAGSDPDGDTIRFKLISVPSHGQINLVSEDTGSFTYTPDFNFFGTDIFTFVASDEEADSVPVSAELIIAPANDAPEAIDGFLKVITLDQSEGTLKGFDVDNDTLTFSIEDNSVMGEVSLTDPSTGAYTYTPYSAENGFDLFTFNVTDQEGVKSPSAEVVVNILIPQGEVVRDISGDGCKLDVTLAVTPVSSVLSYVVEEIIPEGLLPADISNEGVWDQNNGSIKWGPFQDNNQRSLGYTLTGEDNTYSLMGYGNLDGWEQSATGEKEAVFACGSQRVAAPEFNPATGAKVPVEVAISSPTPGSEIHYTIDGSKPTKTSPLYSAPLFIDQALTLRAKAYKEGLYESVVSLSEYLPERSHKAIIVAGGGPYTGNSLWSSTRLVSEYSYMALLYQGYRKDEIMYLSAEPGIDVDGNGALDDIDGEASIATLQDAITNWALDSDTLTIFLTDHGGDGTFQLTPTVILSAADLDLWLDTLQQTMTGQVTLIYDACRSGTFVPQLLPPEGAKRMVITSSSNESAWFLGQGKLSFSYQFWASVFGSGNVYKAYSSASKMMGRYQTAQLDADGDGIQGEPNDQAAALSLVLGRGAVSAGVEPEIGTVSEPVELGTATSSLITASNITSLNGLEKVWAEIVPPDYSQTSPDVPVIEMENIELSDIDGDGVWQGTYANFTQTGIYNIDVYAQDKEGLYSKPKHTAVAKGTILPDSYEDDNTQSLASSIVLNNELTQLHNFHEANDADWVKFYGVSGQTYTISVLNPESNTDAQVEIFAADGVNVIGSAINAWASGEDEVYNFIPQEDGLYFVKITNVNGFVFGALTKYDLSIRRNIAGATGIIQGTIYSAIDQSRLEGVTLNAGLGSSVSSKDGDFKIIAEPGDYTLSVTASGFQTISRQVTVSEGTTLSFDLSLSPECFKTFYIDADGDSFGDPNSVQQACSTPSGYVTNNKDCDDTDAKEQPDQSWYLDVDGDGYTGSATVTSCLRPQNSFLASELILLTGDNCPDIKNSDQDDCDQDGIGNACDQESPCSNDSDGDGVNDAADACPSDKLKVEPGQCGCGIIDKDKDGDGSIDCAIIPGDINDDNRVDEKDMDLCLKILSGQLSSDQVNIKADVNGDSLIGLEEILFILRKLQ